MLGITKCPSCGYRIAAPSTPYTDTSVTMIESLTREVEYLRLVNEQLIRRAQVQTTDGERPTVYRSHADR